jgi:hypothetical protein
MKYLLTKSKILDLNYTFVQSGSGSVDNVTYSVPAHSQGVLSVDAQGKVTALVEQGTGIVEIKSGNALLESVAIEVMPLADYNIAMGIKTGSTPLSVSSSVAVVPQGPPPSTQISLNTMTAASQVGYTAFANDIYGQGGQTFLAFNGSVIGSDHVSFYVPNISNQQSAGQILPAPKTLTRYEIRTSGNSDVQKWVIEGSNNTTTGFDGTWQTIEQKEFTGWSAVMNVNTAFDVTNSTAYKAYRLTALHNPANPGGIWRLAELTLFGY